MNLPEIPESATPDMLPDTQSNRDVRGISIDSVGVKGLRYPVAICSGHEVVSTIATVSMTVGLPAECKGTHMSRFIELLEVRRAVLGPVEFKLLVLEMLHKLRATAGEIEMRFPFFLKKVAPVSLVESRLDYDICWRGRVSADGVYKFTMGLNVPVTSLCPCSRSISEYGAHNQRSRVNMEVDLKSHMIISDLIAIAEGSGSCEIYGLLKRPDEKYVTEKAYDNPKFVEDMVRDVAIALNKELRVESYRIEIENFESIHNHSAFARIASNQPALAL